MPPAAAVRSRVAVEGVELPAGPRFRVARGLSRGRPVREALACEEVGRVGATRDVHHPELAFRENIKPTRLMVAKRALLHEPLEASVVRVEVKLTVEHVRAEGFEGVNDS